jgi:diguanylate cyclase (GGDEF)-like protein
VSQGEVTGLLYLEGLARGDEERQPQHVLIDRLAGQVALALSNAKLRESLRRQSIVDALTGLFNRRYLDETFKREFVRAARKAMPLSLIVLDLDHFKRVNDTFGHEAGDILLKQVAQQIRAEIRESDLACRFGGEEIVLLLPECELDAALDRAEKIRRAISLLEVQVNGRTLGTVTASFGVATFPKHGDTPEALLHAADLALYRAKHEGRNRVMAAA